MLCCVSRRAVEGSVIKKLPLIPPSEKLPKSTFSSPSAKASDAKSEKLTAKDNDLLNEEDDATALLPCTICGRTFKSQSLEKHMIICERAALKKRKPFDSAKQRIKGTELEEFLPKDEKKKFVEERKENSWKQNHDEFIKTIRAVRGDSDNSPSCRQSGLTVASGAPTRANEKGSCPTCHRQFGIKAYDRHVAWCKERIVPAPATPATNVAKERLDARMNYRAPLIKNRRMTNREKYAPNSGIKNNSTSPGVKVKESLFLNCNKLNEAVSIKQPAVTERKKSGQGKADPVIAAGPVKPRLSDRTAKHVDSRNFTALTSFTSSSIIPRSNYQFLDPSASPDAHKCPPSMCHPLSSPSDKTKDSKKRNSKMSPKQAIVCEKGISNHKVNDVMSNDVMGMTIRPADVHGENDPMIIWKQKNDDKGKIITNGQFTTNEKIIDDIKWTQNIQKLDQTYLIKESNDNVSGSIDVIDEYSTSNVDAKEYLYEKEKSFESTKFNADVTCSSTPVSFRENIKERRHKKPTEKIDTMKEKIDDDECNRILSEKMNDDVKKRSSILNYITEQSKILQATEGNQRIDVDKKLNNTKCDFEYRSQKANNGRVIIDEIIPLNSLLIKNNFRNAGCVTPSRTFTSDSIDSVESSQIISIRKKLRKKMHLLRESTDSLVSSIDASNDKPARRRIQGYRMNKEDLPNIDEVNKRTAKKSLMFPEIVTERKIDRPKSFQEREVPYWKRVAKGSRSKLYYQMMRYPKSNFLPPIAPNERRSCSQDFRPSWSSYVRRRPDFNLVLTSRTGICHDYDPFLMADRQLNDLLSDTCSDQSFPDSSSNRYKSTTPIYPLSHSSAFVKYPNSNPLSPPEKRAVIAPPSEFDDLSIGFSSDSTETNSICRELFPDLESSCRREDQNKNKSNQPILGRRIIIDKSKALGTNIESLDDNLNNKNSTIKKSRQIVEKVTTKCIRPQINRSNSVRAASAPKIPERNSVLSNKINSNSIPGTRFHSRNNNYTNFNGSNLSLSSIVSSEVEVKRSNSMFEDLVSSFEDDSGSFPSLRSYLKDDSLSISSPVQASRTRNSQVSDEDLSSPDNYKRPENKLSADSAYSSLNRKYSHNGRNVNDTASRLDEDTSTRRRENDITSTAKSKMSKFCHECGTRFSETAKFCCECGIQRLAL